MKVLPTTAYCMNLDSRPDRWEQVVKDWKRLADVLPIKIERVSAVANTLRPYDGVSQTIRKIMGIAKSENLDYVLIVEDDLFVIDPIKVNQCLENAPDNWDILSGGVYHYVPENPWSVDWMGLKDFCSLHFIIIRNTIYDKILELTGKSQHIDRVIGEHVKAKHFVMYLMHPMPCQQRPGFSNIRKRNVDDNKKILPWVKHPDTII